MRISPRSAHLLDMDTERRRATSLDGAHDATLAVGQCGGMCNAISGAPWRRKMSATSSAGFTARAQLGGVPAMLVDRI